MESDPAGLLGGLNSYGYVGSDPLVDSDSLGLSDDSFGSDWGRSPGPGVGDASGEAQRRLAQQLTRMLQDLRDKRSDYQNYKQRCNEPPPPGLDKCAEAKWKLQRNKDCRSMRQAWDDKWQPGRHANDIRNLDRSIEKLQSWIDQNCCGNKK